MQTPETLLQNNPYPGRGILLGTAGDGRSLLGYFIMGRSASSRARIFAKRGDSLVTLPLGGQADEARLLLYTAFRPLKGRLVVANGTHTDTICAHITAGGSPRDALDKRTYEPDPPHYTPRIAGVVAADGSLFFGILKNEGGRCVRAYFDYPAPAPGCGYLLHTYATDGNPLPPYRGAPAPLALEGSFETLFAAVWAALDPNNRVALYMRCTDLVSGAYQERIQNRFA